jgi:hypothetical protein
LFFRVFFLSSSWACFFPPPLSFSIYKPITRKSNYISS